MEYEAQVYNTIQVFSQCWLKESLNIGIMILRTMEQSNNVGNYGHWWSLTEIDCDTAWGSSLVYDSPGVRRGNSYEVEGLSVRCLSDN